MNARDRVPIVVALFALTASGWVAATGAMAGMDEGPGTDPGALGAYISLWVAMIGAMMIPSVAPMIAVHAEVERRRRELGRDTRRGASAHFLAGYALAWAVFGLLAYGVDELVRSLDVGALSWSREGRYAAAAVIGLAAVYQLTGLKDACLAKCRNPVAFVVGSWRDGRMGPARMGLEQGAWCVGCCWALMATLFAIGLMSVVWMAVVAGLVAVEKLVPWGWAASRAVALFLIVLAVAVAVAPEQVPALTIPGG